jgi:gluconolactonase
MRQNLIIAVIALLVPAQALGQDMPLSDVLLDGQGWSLASKGYEEILRLQGFTTGAVGVYHNMGMKNISTDMTTVDRVHGDARHNGPSLYFGLNNNGYGVNPSSKSLLVSRGAANIDTPEAIQIAGLNCPNYIAFSADFGTLFVGDRDGTCVWVFRIEQDGRLTAGQPYCPLRLASGQTGSGVAALTLDKAGRIYAATPQGVQIFDPTGRLCGVLSNPVGEALVAVAFGGPDGKRLFVASKNTVYMRKVQVQGQSFDPNAKFTLPPPIRQK